MMRKLIMAGIAMLTVAISSCDEETGKTGNSLTSDIDKFSIATDTFFVSTRSIKADSILSKSVYTYLGQVKDPETGSYIKSDYTTQLHLLENESKSIFPPKDSIVSRNSSNEVKADSSFLYVAVYSYQGDSLAAMKINVRELDRPIGEAGTYYSNFDPESKGYVRTDPDAVNQNKVFSISDLTLSESQRNGANNSFVEIKIPLNKPYADKNGTLHENYGTYLMRTYYAHPEYFKNSQTFTRNVCPGFYFKTTDGLGAMVEVHHTRLDVYFTAKQDTAQYLGFKSLYSTEEVLQTTHITNDKTKIDRLVNDNQCTYLKTPAGIFTEVTLPIEDIKRGHENDSVTSAKITFQRLNEQSDYSDIVLEEPTNLLMVERDSLYHFFEKNEVPNNITNFIASFNSVLKTYTFNNLSTLINRMYARRGQTPTWNKAILVPVQLVTSTTSSSYTTSTNVVGVTNEMNVNSVRLVGGSQNPHEPIRISIIYSKNE